METAITEAEWIQAVRAASRKSDTANVGASELTRFFANGKLQKTLTHTRLYHSPDRRWTLDIEEDSAKKRRTDEYVKIGEQEYVRINGGKWRKTVRYPTTMQVPADSTGVEIKDSFRKTTGFLNGKEFSVYISERNYRQGSKTSIYIERSWISSDGMLVREEQNTIAADNGITEMEFTAIVDYGIANEGKVEAKIKLAKSKK